LAALRKERSELPVIINPYTFNQYPLYKIQIHVALSLLEIVAWLKRKSTAISVTAQGITLFAILSDAFTSVLVKNNWGVIGAILILLRTFGTQHLHVDDEAYNTARKHSSLLSAVSSMVFTKSILEVVRYNREELMKEELFKEKWWWSDF
jgi:hypothetical protein